MSTCKRLPHARSASTNPDERARDASSHEGVRDQRRPQGRRTPRRPRATSACASPRSQSGSGRQGGPLCRHVGGQRARTALPPTGAPARPPCAAWAAFSRASIAYSCVSYGHPRHGTARERARPGTARGKGHGKGPTRARARVCPGTTRARARPGTKAGAYAHRGARARVQAGRARQVRRLLVRRHTAPRDRLGARDEAALGYVPPFAPDATSVSAPASCTSSIAGTHRAGRAGRPGSRQRRAWKGCASSSPGPAVRDGRTCTRPVSSHVEEPGPARCAPMHAPATARLSAPSASPGAGSAVRGSRRTAPGSATSGAE